MKNKLLKRISAAFIAMCIAVSLVPAVFADGTEETAGTKTYSFYASAVSGFTDGNNVNEVKTFGDHGWYFKDIDDTAHRVGITGDLATYENGTKTSTNRRVMQLHTNDLKLYVKRKAEDTGTKDDPYYELTNIQIAFVLKAPEKGFYRVEGKGMYKNQLYLDKYKVGKENVEDYVNDKAKFYSTTNFGGSSTDYSKAAATKQVDGIVYSDGVSDLLLAIDTLDSNYSYRAFRELSLVPIEQTISLVVDKTTLTAGEETKAYVNATWTEDSAETTQKMLNSFVTYDSTNKAAATVDENGEITAVAPGNTTITATVDGVDVYKQPISVTAPTVSFYAESNDNTNVPITIAAADADGNEVEAAKAATLNRGAEVTVNAPEKEGYLFVGWFRGSKDTGRFVWADNEYTFNAMTHTMLTAVYEETTSTEAYYNFSGEFLGTSRPASNPTMLGYVFNEWAQNTEIATLTRYVAQYDKDTTAAYQVTLPSGMTPVLDEDDYYYDTKVTLTSNTDVTWLRNEKPVAYGREYTFYVWDDVEITTAPTADTAPKVILDSSKSGAYMIEYDKGDADGIVEAGIIFGNDKNITINSCEEKMNSQRNEDRGQFSAKVGSYAVARGYLIYEDDGDYKVIYAD